MRLTFWPSFIFDSRAFQLKHRLLHPTIAALVESALQTGIPKKNPLHLSIEHFTKIPTKKSFEIIQ